MEFTILNKIFSEDISRYIINYIYPNKIPKDDIRYYILMNIPVKEFDPIDEFIYVYLTIDNTKDFMLSYNNFEYRLQKFSYNDSHVFWISGESYIMEGFDT